MVVQLAELFWVHPKFTCHLHVLMRQVEPAPRVDPRLQACRCPFLIFTIEVCLAPALCSLANGGCIQWPRPESVRGGQQWPSPSRLCRFGERAHINCARYS